MKLQALRHKLGDRAFFAVLLCWAGQHRYGTATPADFVRLAERVSGRDLGAFFRTWLYQPGKPLHW